MTTNVGLTINNSAANYFWNLQIVTDVTLSSDIVVLNNLTITAAGALDVSAANRQITVGHNWTRTAPGTFNARYGRVIFNNDGSPPAGGTLSTTDAAGETFWNLRVDKAADTLVFDSDFTVISEIHLANGTLAEGVGSRTITMGTASSPIPPQYVIWRNDVDMTGGTGFAAGNGKVQFMRPAPVEYHILGRTTFFEFECLVPNAVLKFEDNTTGTYGATDRATRVTGDFHIVGAAGNLIVLDNTSGSSAAGCGANPDTEHWVLHIIGTATIDYVNVSNSWAPPSATVTPGPNTFNGGNNCNWLFVIPIIAYWTLDTDGNGRIDRIRVQVDVGTQLSDNFDPAKLRAAVRGYTVIGFGTAGGANDDVFDILLQEGPYLDTDARPQWQLLTNDQPNGLYGIVGGAYVKSGSDVYTADDGARPVIGYTLAVAGQNRAYLHFSEPVYTDAAASAPITSTDFAYSDGGNPIASLSPEERSGTGAHAAMITFNGPLVADNLLLASAETLNAVAGQVYDQLYTVNPGLYANTNLDGNLNPGNKPMLATAHRVSDVGLGLIDPVFATTGDLYPQRDPLRGGIGRITAFDGSGWLRDLDIQLQARILAATATNWTTTMTFDVNVADPILLGGLWIPSGTTTLFPPAGRDGFHNANTNISSAPGVQTLGPGSPLRDFSILASEPKIKDGADLQFLFILDDGAGNLLPCARVANPTDPRTARPWSYKIRDMRVQRGNVTIMRNVINPTRGEKTDLHYSIGETGYLTIMVFDLKGDVVNILFRGQRSPGEYSTTWDGRNRGGRVVARGMYFIKVVGPGMNEIRKVLVVK
jgi:fibronectin-binding autotransporter adhesin